MIPTLLELTYNLALLVALSLISGFIKQHRQHRLWVPVLQGVLFGGAAVIGMMRPLVLGPGLIFDGRSIMLSLCGLFFGPVAAGVAGGMALLYRMILGGTGVHMGGLVIMASTLLGLGFHQLWVRRGQPLTAGRLWLLGLLVHAVMLLLMFTLPAGAGPVVIKRLGLPILLVYPLVTVLIGKVIASQEAGMRSVAALRESEERWKFAIEGAGDGLWDWNVQTGSAYYSPRYKEMFGYAEADFGTTAEEWSKRIHPDDAPGVFAALQPYMEGKPGFAMVEFRMLCQDGSWRWTLGRGMVVSRDPAGKPMRMIGVNSDITERKQAEDALLEAKALTDAVVENVPLMIFLKEATDLKFVLFNHAGEKLLGHDRKELLGKNDLDLFPPEQAAHFMAMDRKVLEGGAGVLDIPEETVSTAKKGQRVLHTRKVCLLGSDGSTKYLLGISEDITERKQAEAERLNLQAQLQQSQKMESLGTLAGGVAHDMNNVLGAILGLASAHIGAQPEGSPLHQALDTICKATERGGKMVKSLLSFARQSPAESHKLDMNAILREQVSLLERTTLATVRLQLDLAAELLPILGDASALTHAFMNLCVNAGDAMPGSGTLILQTRNVDNDWIEVVVEDNGMGMPKEVLEKAVEPFFTTKETGKGTGLGLSMVFSTVKAHQGQMAIESEPGKGTRVRMRFPACERDAPVQVAEPAVAEAALIPHGGMKVLLIDDDELIQSSTQAILECLGHTAFTTAQSGEEALALLEAGFEPDLVILDMNMPGLGGIGTLPRIRRLRPAVPVLLSTGRTDQAALTLASAHSGVTLLAKPFGLRELQKHLESIGLG
jgi:PAS domain S-box-containing protein